MFQNVRQVQEFIQEKGIQFVDFKMIDFRGRWKHLSIPAARFTEDILENGIVCLTPEDRKTMLRFANGAAYIVTTRKGAIRSMPERSEVEALLAAN